MRLNSSLKPGNYENKLIISVVSNLYTPKAVMTEGQDFNEKLKDLETWTNKIEHFKKSNVAPAASMNTVNIEDEDSDYEIKLWLDSADKTAYYYTEPEKVYLNENSSYMFVRTPNILDIDISNFDTSKVIDMEYMFMGMSSLTSLDISNFDTSKVTNMECMFYYMSSLTSLDISNFDTSRVTNMQNMFALYDEDISKDKLEKIYVNNDFNTSQLTFTGFFNMFGNRKKLRGGAGSYLSNPSTADETWLRIDDPANGRPGYFTRKS